MFEQNFMPEGAEINPDTPRKKGLARLFEILSRDLDGIFLSGALAMLVCVPAAILAGIALWLGSLPLCLLAAVAAGWLVGPALTGLYDTILRALRDEPGFWWHTYKRMEAELPKQSCSRHRVYRVVGTACMVGIRAAADDRNLPELCADSAAGCRSSLDAGQLLLDAERTVLWLDFSKVVQLHPDVLRLPTADCPLCNRAGWILAADSILDSTMCVYVSAHWIMGPQSVSSILCVFHNGKESASGRTDSGYQKLLNIFPQRNSRFVCVIFSLGGNISCH